MTHLTLTTPEGEVHTSTETVPDRIARLLRKGWVEVDAPEEPELTADEAKETTFRTALAAGHTVTEGWTFALGDQDRINWDQYAAHHERKLARNQVALADFAPMIDITGTPRVVTVERMLEIIVEIGDAYQALFFARHQPTP